jgi:hypothetical protein
MDKDIKAVEVRAELRQVKSMVDSSVNITLNIPEDCIEMAQVLLGWIGKEIKVYLMDETK